MITRMVPSRNAGVEKKAGLRHRPAALALRLTGTVRQTEYVVFQELFTLGTAPLTMALHNPLKVSAHVNTGVTATSMYPQTQPDVVFNARYVRPSRFFLRFADGYEGVWTFAQLGLDMSNMKPATIRATGGKKLVVKSKWGDDVELDCSSLRTLVDDDYAARLEARLDALAMRIGL